MRKTLILGGIMLVLFVAGLFVGRGVFTGRAVLDTSKENLTNYSWTKAICNSGGECLDVMVHCSGDRVVGVEPVSRIIQHGYNWTDPRGIEKDRLCG